MSRGSNRDPKVGVSTTTRRDTAEEAAEARRKLDALFGGGKTAAEEKTPQRKLSQPVRRTSSGKVFASPRKSTGRAPSDYRLRLERLRMAREDDAIKEATDAFLKHHQLPDDLDILYKVLQHPSEKVVRDALGQISSLLMQGRLPGTLVLQDRLKTLSNVVEEDATKSYIEGLRHQLKALDE